MGSKKTTIGALLDETGGSIKTGPFGTKLKASEYTEFGVPVVSVGEVGLGRLRIHDKTPRVDETVWSKMPEFLLKAGDIVFGRKGAVDRSAQVQSSEEGYFLGSDGIRIRLNTKTCDPKFISYQLQTIAHRDWMVQNAAGTTMPSLNEGIIRRIPIVLKPLAEQKRIAHILGTLDDKIELNRRMNATLEAMARVLFQSWFVDFDPVRRNAKGDESRPEDSLFPNSFEDSEMGEIPNGWHVVKLKDLTSKIGSGSTPRGGSAVYQDEGTALIRSQNVHDHEFRWQGLVRLSEKSSHELRGVEVKIDDVLINITGDSILRTCVVDPAVLPARVNQHVAIIRAMESVPARYLHLHLIQARMKEFPLGLSAGATRHAVTKGHLENIPVLRPPAEVLRAFREMVAPIFKQVEVNSAQSRTLAALRDTLLPKLLNGELSEPERTTIPR